MKDSTIRGISYGFCFGSILLTTLTIFHHAHESLTNLLLAFGASMVASAFMGYERGDLLAEARNQELLASYRKSNARLIELLDDANSSHEHTLECLREYLENGTTEKMRDHLNSRPIRH